MVKKFCERCGKEIIFSKSYEIFYGKVDYKEEFKKNQWHWSCTSGLAKNLCKECFTKIEEIIDND